MNTNKSDKIHFSLTGDKDQDEQLLRPLTYFADKTGKEFECNLIHAFNHWLDIPDDKLQTLDDIIKILHDSSLLIDDIEDNATMRKGIPVAHTVYGIPNTINAANYGYFIGFERILTLNHPQVAQVFMEQLLELHRGHGIEIFWRDNLICPSEPQFKTMIIQKTGGLFKLGVRLMQLFSDCKKDFIPLLGLLGLYFQIRDDYCSLCMQEYEENKGYCEDLTEGKFSFPIRHAIESGADGGQVLNILRQRTENIQLKKYCVSLLDKLGSFAYTRKVLTDLDKQAREEIEKLGGNPYLTAVLDRLLDWRKDDGSHN